MAGQFLTKSRHGSIYYFRRRVPQAAQQLIGRRVLVQSLETSDRRAAIIRSRALATQTDAIFQRIAMTTKSSASDGFTFNYEMKLDFNELGMPLSLHVKAEPEEQEAVNSAIRAALVNDRAINCDMQLIPTTQCLSRPSSLSAFFWARLRSVPPSFGGMRDQGTRLFPPLPEDTVLAAAAGPRRTHHLHSIAKRRHGSNHYCGLDFQNHPEVDASTAFAGCHFF